MNINVFQKDHDFNLENPMVTPYGPYFICKKCGIHCHYVQDNYMEFFLKNFDHLMTNEAKDIIKKQKFYFYFPGEGWPLAVKLSNPPISCAEIRIRDILL